MSACQFVGGLVCSILFVHADTDMVVLRHIVKCF